MARSVTDAATRALFVAGERDPKAEAMLAGLEARGARSVFVRYLASLGGHPTADAVHGAIATTLAWGPLMRKRISRLTAEAVPWWTLLFGTMIGASVAAERHERDRFCGIATADIVGKRSLTEVAYVALLGLDPAPANLFAFQTLVGLLLTNGPGAISAQGAKGAVSADGPETPERVQLNKALVGFLTHSGYTHGGNGYEGIAFLLDQFRDTGLADPTDPAHGVDLAALAHAYVDEYARYKAKKKNVRQPRHPEDSRRQSSGVQGPSGQPRPARGLRSGAVRESAASTTSSTSTTTRWCRRCSTPASRATSTASTSTR